MNNKSVQKILLECEREIQSIKAASEKFPVLAKEREYFAKYLLIYVSGVLEICYKRLISDYCLSHSNPLLHNYFENVIVKASKNATIDNICEHLKNIDNNLKNKFKETLKKKPNYEQITSSLKSLSTLRNGLAHGVLTTQFYFSEIVSYYFYSVEMIKTLDEVLAEQSNLHQTTM
jgi:hypothetical protein